MTFLLELTIQVKIPQKGTNVPNTIEILQNELPKYAGLTKSEKNYGLSNLDKWIPENGRLEVLIEKFAEKSLNIKPFLEQVDLLKTK
jgi:hypothetical protein